MTVWSFYDPKTGALAARTFRGRDKLLTLNTPAGLAPIEGQLDPLSQRVDVEALAASDSADHPSNFIVDYRPPQPSDQHEWDVKSRRWRLTLEAQQEVERDELARREIAAIEQLSGPRAVREALIAVLPDGTPEKSRLLELDAEAAEQRKNIIR